MLTRFTESFIATADYYQLIEKRQITESDKTNLSNLVRENKLSESTIKYLEKSNVANLTGKNVYRFPISRYDGINANGRKYEGRLWTRVINEQKEAYQGNVGLADHPMAEDDGQFKHAGVVWLNMGLDEANKIVWGEGILVGPHGRLAEEILEAGGRIGFSSSGFGELEESDKSTVRWDSYQLERPADIVLNPSQNVYGTWDMKLPKDDKAVTHESIQESVEKIIEAKETRMSEVKLSKLEEKRILRDIEKFYEEAMAIADPQSRLEELQDLSLPFNENTSLDSAMKAKIEASIVEAHTEIKKAISEHIKIKSTFDVDNVEAIKEGFKKIATDTQLFEREAMDWKAIAEGLQDKVKELQAVNSSLPTVEAYNTAMTYTQKLKESFKDHESELLSKISTLTSQLESAGKKVTALKAEKATVEATNATILANFKKLKEYALSLKKKIVEEEQTQELADEEAELLEAKKNEINFRPTATRNEMLSGFAETDKVTSYYEDLEERHGKVIQKHKDRILRCKTLKEAMKLYTGILANMDVSRTAKLSEAFDPDERKRIIEAQTAKKIKTNQNLHLPKGWE